MVINFSAHTFYKSAWFHVIVNLLLFLLLSYFMPIRYESNDDTTLILLASGEYSGTPEAHLVFINYIYGLFVSSLYSLYNGLEWYTICFAAIHILSLSIISWRVVNVNINILWKLLSILYLYLFEMVIVYYFQFTTTAALCATGAILLFITSDKKWHKYLAIFLFTVASLIRFHPTLLVFMVCGPMLLLYIFEHSQRRNTIILLSLFIVLPLIAKGLDSLVYNTNTDWREYKEFNEYRGKITDNPNAFNLTVYPPNIDSASYILFSNFFPDTKQISIEKLKETHAFIDDIPLSKKNENIQTNIDSYETLLILFGFFALLLIIIHEDNRRKILVLSTVIVTLILLYYVSLDGLVKLRVFISAALPFVLVFFYACSSLRRKDVVRLTALVLFILVMHSGRSFLRYKRVYREYRASQVRSTKEILAQAKKLLNEDELVIPFAASIRLEESDPYSISKSLEMRNIAILGWLAKSPLNKGRIDSYLDFIGKNAICITKYELRELWPLLSESIFINYGIEVEYEIIADAEKLVLIRLNKCD